MTTTYIDQRGPAQWRVLHKLINAWAGDQHVTATTLIREQDASEEYLVRLERDQLVTAAVGGTPVALADCRVLDDVGVWLTHHGRTYVQTSGPSLVIRVLHNLRDSSLVRNVLRQAQPADQDDLMTLDQAGLIEGLTGDGGSVCLHTFRRVPDELRLRLTRRGRLFVAR